MRLVPYLRCTNIMRHCTKFSAPQTEGDVQISCPLRSVYSCLALETQHRIELCLNTEEAGNRNCFKLIKLIHSYTFCLTRDSKSFNVKKMYVAMFNKVWSLWRLRTAMFWVTTQWVMVIPYQRFGTNYQSDLQGSRKHFMILHFLNTQDALIRKLQEEVRVDRMQ
jgi:hypothetical protein